MDKAEQKKLDTAAELMEQLDQVKARNQLNAEKLRGQDLARRVKKMERLQEAVGDVWVGQFVDLIDKYRNEPNQTPTGPGPFADRLQGRNWPIFQNESELRLLRAPARVLVATNGYAQGLIEGLTSYVIGSGFSYRVAAKPGKDVADDILDACQYVLDEFMERSEWYGGELPGLEEELFQRSVEDGEAFLVHFPQEGGKTEVRTIEPEQVTQPAGLPAVSFVPEDPDQTDWLFGVGTKTGDVQNPLGYWVKWMASGEGICYPADQVTHIRRNVKRSMKRGLSDFTFDTYDSLQLASVLRTNMADGAAQQASIVGVMQYNGVTSDDVNEFLTGDADTQKFDPATGKQFNQNIFRRGRWEHIPQGQTYVPPPSATNGPVHLQILQACLRGAGVKWNAPEWLSSGDASNNNYASSLTAESPFVRTVLRRQRSYCAAFRRTMMVVLRNAAACQVIKVGGMAVSWDRLKDMIEITATAPSPETRNKLGEAQQASIEIPLGVDSRQRYCESQGRDYAQINQDNEDYLEQTGGGPAQLPLPGQEGL